MTIDELNAELDARESGGQPFPTDALPAAAAGFTRALSESLNVEESQIGALVLPILAAAIGNSFRLSMTRTWQAKSILWVGLVADSGALKTPALNAASAPVDALEKAAYASQGDAEPRTRYRIGDATIEAIAALLEDNPRGLLMQYDELAGWLGSFNKYNRGSSDLQAWLDLENGNALHVDRKHAPAIYVPHPAVSVVGTIQPGILADSLKAAHFNSGFAARLLLVYPNERAPKWIEAEPTDEVLAAYERLVHRLYKLPYDGEPRILHLSPEAKAAWKTWYDANGQRQHACKGNTPLKLLYAKAPQIAAKFALILQLADAVTDDDPAGVGFPTAASAPADLTVSEAVLLRAIELTEWFAGEYARIIDELDLSQSSDDEALCELLPETFGAKDVAALQRVLPRQGRNIIKRLIRKGYARKLKNGVYENLHAKR